ncbi:MAG: 3-deoxy-manno-octulosonate cytidylyltransferase [Pseudomonadota bacterium]
MSRVWIVIPARYASSRFPGKPLVALKGADGMAKSLVQRAWEAAVAVEGVERVLVATDDDRIASAVEGFGGTPAMTAALARNGTERCAEIAGWSDPPDLIVNLQGDAPLTPPAFVTSLIDTMAADPAIPVTTPVLACSEEALARFRADRAAGRVGGTLAVMDAAGRALYFSKEVIPFGADAATIPAYHHIGVYGYRIEALRRYADLEPGVLERAEGLEQLRFLENGIDMRCIVQQEEPGTMFWEVNNPGDVAVVEEALAARHIV